MVANVVEPNRRVGSAGNRATGASRVRRGLSVAGLVVLLGVIQNPVSEWLATMRLTPQPELFTELSFAQPDEIVEMMQTTAAQRNAAFVVANHESAATTYRWVVTATEPSKPKRRVLTGRIRLDAGTKSVVRPNINWAALPGGTRIEIGLAQRKELISLTLAGGGQ